MIIIGYKLYRMPQRVDITFYDSYTNIDEVSLIQINNENFYMVFSLINKEGKAFIDKTIYL